MRVVNYYFYQREQATGNYCYRQQDANERGEL